MSNQAEARREALRARVRRGVSERGQVGLNRKSVLDFSHVGDKPRIQYEMNKGADINTIDLLPFVITQPWYKDLQSVSGSKINLAVGEIDYKLEVPVHRSIGEDNNIFICLKKAFGKKCPICEELFEEYKLEESKRDNKKIQSLKPKWRCFYNVYDYNDPDHVVKLWEDESYYLFEQMLQEAVEENIDGVETFADLEEGKTIVFKGREKSLGKKGENPFIEAHSFSFEDREIYEKSILDKTFPLDAMLIIPTYEEVLKAHLAIEDIDDANETKQDEPEQKTVQQRARRGTKITEDETEQEEIEKETEQEDKCPAGYVFGETPNTHNECSDCDEDIFQQCIKENEKNKKTPVRSRDKNREVSEKQSNVPETGNTRRRRRQ